MKRFRKEFEDSLPQEDIEFEEVNNKINYVQTSRKKKKISLYLSTAAITGALIVAACSLYIFKRDIIGDSLYVGMTFDLIQEGHYLIEEPFSNGVFNFEDDAFLKIDYREGQYKITYADQNLYLSFYNCNIGDFELKSYSIDNNVDFIIIDEQDEYCFTLNTDKANQDMLSLDFTSNEKYASFKVFFKKMTIY